MKILKTLDMMQELKYDERKKFTREDDNDYVAYMKNGLFYTKCNGVDQISNNLDSEWIEIKSPVSFEEVLGSDSRCKLKYKNINVQLDRILKLKTLEKNEEVYCNMMKKDKYLEFGEIMKVLSKYINQNLLKDILLNGKWYLED